MAPVLHNSAKHLGETGVLALPQGGRTILANVIELAHLQLWVANQPAQANTYNGTATTSSQPNTAYTTP